MIDQRGHQLKRGFLRRVQIVLVSQRKHKTGAAIPGIRAGAIQILDRLAEQMGGGNQGFFMAVRADDTHGTLLKVSPIIANC